MSIFEVRRRWMRPAAERSMGWRRAPGLLAAPLLLAGGLLIQAGAAGAEPPPDRADIALWPGEPPGPTARFEQPQTVLERSRDPAVQDRAVLHITRPELRIFRPERPDGSAMLVLPGGAYARVVVDKEAEEIAPPLNAAGITLFRLFYRLPGGGQAPEAPLADAQRALRLIRANAAEWGIDPARIGVLGFSAGGHLAARLGTRFDQPAYAAVDAADQASARPDFLALGYPVISLEEGVTHPQSRQELAGAAPDAEAVARHSNERHARRDMPPVFLFGAGDDADVPVANTLRFYDAARAAGVPAELHLFQKGGHGFSIRFARGLPAAEWPNLLANWVRAVAPAR